jgi:retron-type reverse transcriptase
MSSWDTVDSNSWLFSSVPPLKEPKESPCLKNATFYYQNISGRASYAHLYVNKGALTPGNAPTDTVDGMSLKRIEALMASVRKRTFRWKPVRRTYLAKHDARKKRPLGMAGFNEKLRQDVIRQVLEAYYEPQFRNSSHGFRPQRGGHTALDTIGKWKGTRWYIEGDIKKCFDRIPHMSSSAF